MLGIRALSRWLPPRHELRALAHALNDYFASLRRHGTTAPFRNRMLDFAALNELIGTPEMLALGRRYDSDRPGAAR